MTFRSGSTTTRLVIFNSSILDNAAPAKSLSLGKMERETGFESAASTLAIPSKSLK
jgi:hypothetical protein